MFSSAKVQKIIDIRKKKQHKMTWLEEKIEYALTYAAPKGFGVNSKVLRPIAKKLIKTEGICPCHHAEWNENTTLADKQCPCKTFRETWRLPLWIVY